MYEYHIRGKYRTKYAIKYHFQETLENYASLFWIDTSFRLLNVSLERKLAEKSAEYGGILLLHNSPHSNAAVTHQGMYEYLPSNVTRLAQTMQCGGGMLFYVNTKENYESVMKWHIRCALNVDCIAPPDSTHACPKDMKELQVFTGKSEVPSPGSKWHQHSSPGP